MGEEKKRLLPAFTVKGEDHGKGSKTESSSLLCDWKLFGARRIQIGSEAEEVWHKPVTSHLGASSRIWGQIASRFTVLQWYGEGV